MSVVRPLTRFTYVGPALRHHLVLPSHHRNWNSFKTSSFKTSSLLSRTHLDESPWVWWLGKCLSSRSLRARHPLWYSVRHSLVILFINSFIHSFIRSFIHLFNHSFIRLFIIHSFFHSFIHYICVRSFIC